MPLVFSYGPEVVERVVCPAALPATSRRRPRRATTASSRARPTSRRSIAAEEAGVHFIAGGHYATETLGVRALSEKLAERFDVAWDFLSTCRTPSRRAWRAPLAVGT